MREYKHILLLICLGSISLLGTACSSDDNDGQPTPPVETENKTEGIGTYRFRGIERPITSGLFSVDEAGGITCILSPEDLTGKNISTYFAIYLAGYWVGRECNTVTDELWKNMDYTFTYEDPFYYYSRYQNITGKIYIKKNSEKNLTVSLNVRLHDNVHFKADVTADLVNTTSTESNSANAKVAQLELRHKQLTEGETYGLK